MFSSMLYPSPESSVLWMYPTPSPLLRQTAQQENQDDDYDEEEILPQEYYDTLFEQEMLATDYTTGYDQWQIWDRRKKRRMWNRSSLLSESDIDPTVQQHMMWVLTPKPPPPSSLNLMIPKSALVRTATAVDSVTDNHCKGQHTPHVDHYHHHHEKEEKSVCSTRATEISDDSLRFHVPPSWLEDDDNCSDDDCRDQQTIATKKIVSPSPPRRQSSSSSSSSSSSKTPPPPPLTVLSKDRVKRALARGDSLRVLECSGCQRQLFVTPDIALVYCPMCACFSRLKMTE